MRSDVDLVVAGLPRRPAGETEMIRSRVTDISCRLLVVLSRRSAAHRRLVAADRSARWWCDGLSERYTSRISRSSAPPWLDRRAQGRSSAFCSENTDDVFNRRSAFPQLRHNDDTARHDAPKRPETGVPR